MKTFPLRLTITMDLERNGLTEAATIKGTRYIDGEIDGTYATVDGKFVELTRAEELAAEEAIESEYVRIMSVNEARKEDANG